MIKDILALPRIAIAHRGNSSAFDENSIRAFTEAHRLGSHILETDVHLTLDRQIVIFHDEDLYRIYGISSRVSDLTLAELRSLSFERGNTILTLHELLEAIPDACFNIDLKTDDKSLVEVYARLLTDLRAVDRVITASFHHRMLTAFRHAMPQAVTSASPREVLSLLSAWWTRPVLPFVFPKLAKGKLLQIPEYQGPVHVASPGFLKALNQSGGMAHIWTINDRETASRLFDSGARGIVSDNPAMVLDLIAR